MQSNRLTEEKYMDTSRTGQEFPSYTSNLPVTKYTALARQVLTQIKLVKRKDIQLMHCVAQVKKNPRYFADLRLQPHTLR